MKTQNYLLPWSKESAPTGEGLTRTSSPGARLFSYRITFNDAPAMRCTVRALTVEQAEGFVRFRHPTFCTITLL